MPNLDSRLPLLVLLGAFCAPALCRADGPRPVDFNRDIRPILSNNCYKCHGPDENERQAGLRLDVHESALARLDSGHAAVVPGRSAESELFARISTADPDLKMPPAESGKTLTAEQIALLKKWIDEGAPWKGHWSFITPQRPDPPAVKHEEAVQNPIDRFVIARLEAEGLGPAPPAEKVTLLRRVTYDLTGLPPTLAEIDAFLADDSPRAYEKVVDRLLASPRYGEHMARFWLDGARYGDTHGLHFDNERSLWPYRDWVVRSFNRNQPFNEFTIEQLAGDLLPNATLEQQLATGFNRCNVTTSEGGSINEEVLVRYGVDRVEATATVFLGLTAGCAACHDHKYDPLKQKEFYQLFAFFNNNQEQAMDGNALSPPPIIKTPSEEHRQKQAALREQLAAARQRLADELARIEYEEPPAAEPSGAEPREYVWIEDALPSGAKPQGDAPGWKFITRSEGQVYSGEKATVRTSKGLSQHFFTEAKPGLKIGEGDKLFAYVYLDPADPPKEIMLQFNDGSWEHRAYWGENLIEWGESASVSRQPMGALPEAGKWVRLEVEIEKVGLKPGAILNGWAFTQFDGAVYWDKAGSVTRTPQDGQSFDSQIAWEAYEKAQSKSTLPAPVQEALKAAAQDRNEAQKKTLRDHFLTNVYPKSKAQLEPISGQIADLTKQQTDLENSIPTSLVMQEMAQPRETFVLIRGAYDKKGEKVAPGVPAALPPLPKDAPLNRLGLAQWLVDPEHPLTARVAVNRFWQQYFGQGIVKTSEDFGSQGSWPTHPELLDWLATEFIRGGWNVKEMQKLIVMSGAYRQSSKVSPPLLARDPGNELLARGPRFRLDAEMVRDGALFVAGLLVEKQGGRGVRPYQPEGIWEAVAFQGSNTQNFKPDQGDGLYRRSLYTFWKRTAPPPALTTFDAPSRETCTVRRARTNTPLQALVLLNDKQFVEAARRLAERMMTEGGAGLEERAAHGFRLATGRPPHETESAVLKRVFEAQLAGFRAAPEEAKKLLAYGDSPRNESLDPLEHAAWTMIANVILNLDETVSKE